MNDHRPARVTLWLFILGFVACLAVLAGMRAARAQEPSSDDKRAFFSAVKQGLRADAQVVNCCGEYDAVRVEMIANEGSEIIVRIVDIMQSQHGRVGDIVRIPRGHLLQRIYSPYASPIAFIRKDLSSICLSGFGGF